MLADLTLDRDLNLYPEASQCVICMVHSETAEGKCRFHMFIMEPLCLVGTEALNTKIKRQCPISVPEIHLHNNCM